MKFSEYQRRANATDQNPAPEDRLSGIAPAPQRHEVIPLLGLVGEVGGLLGEYKKMLRDGATHRKFKDEVAEELGDILWYVANTATKFGLDLEEIARSNLSKAEDRWNRRDKPLSLYDSALPADQQLPRQFEYRFEHQQIKDVSKLVLVDQLVGTSTGDPLTDNAFEDDGYRFHDALHLTFAACLGWSPVWRKLLRKQGRLRNREPARIDEVEDGGRAQVIEEAIVAAAYAYASEHDFLHGITAVDWHLLRHIKQMTAKLEVSNRTMWEWNNVLLRGFGIWRLLREHNGGVVKGDLTAGTIKFIPPA